MAKIDFTPAQAQAILERGGALLVAASAGSGKTRVLVERLLEGNFFGHLLILQALCGPSFS